MGQLPALEELVMLVVGVGVRVCVLLGFQAAEAEVFQAKPVLRLLVQLVVDGAVEPGVLPSFWDFYHALFLEIEGG